MITASFRCNIVDTFKAGAGYERLQYMSNGFKSDFKALKVEILRFDDRVMENRKKEYRHLEAEKEPEYGILLIFGIQFKPCQCGRPQDRIGPGSLGKYYFYLSLIGIEQVLFHTCAHRIQKDFPCFAEPSG